MRRTVSHSSLKTLFLVYVIKITEPAPTAIKTYVPIINPIKAYKCSETENNYKCLQSNKLNVRVKEVQQMV